MRVLYAFLISWRQTYSLFSNVCHVDGRRSALTPRRPLASRAHAKGVNVRLKPSVHRKGSLRAMRLLAAITTTAAIASVVGILPASASTASDQVPGGMTRLTSTIVKSPESHPAAKALPSCSRIEYVGNAGFIAVQERNHRLQWGIVMTPLKLSIGKWDVNTYLSGRKTTSGFHRTVTKGYIPHSSLDVRANRVFHVQAKVVGPNGTFVNVPNACRT